MVELGTVLSENSSFGSVQESMNNADYSTFAAKAILISDNQLMQAMAALNSEQSGGFGQMVDHATQLEAYWDEAMRRGLLSEEIELDESDFLN